MHHSILIVVERHALSLRGRAEVEGAIVLSYSALLQVESAPAMKLLLTYSQNTIIRIGEVSWSNSVLDTDGKLETRRTLQSQQSRTSWSHARHSSLLSISASQRRLLSKACPCLNLAA